MSFIVYPAIDVREGRVVRLKQGDYAQETRYDADPAALAAAYSEAGAQWLHLVDLDAARAGGYGLGALLGRIKRETGLSVQTGGGVRSENDVRRLLDAGADRVVIGSLAVRDPESVAEWIARYGADCITVALDTRQDAEGRWVLPVHGWTQTADADRTLDVLAKAYAGIGLRHLLCTDIARDGMLAGPNLQLCALLGALAPSLDVQASGGARDLSDVAAAREAGAAGIVLGKSLLEGRIDLRESLSGAVPC